MALEMKIVFPTIWPDFCHREDPGWANFPQESKMGKQAYRLK